MGDRLSPAPIKDRQAVDGGDQKLTQARQISMILTMVALVIPQHLAGRGNGINIPFPENTRPGGQINMVPTIGDPHYDDYCDFVKATFCPVRGVVLPDMYLSRLLNKRFTTAKLCSTVRACTAVLSTRVGAHLPKQLYSCCTVICSDFARIWLLKVGSLQYALGCAPVR